jgi:hypothetical protein
MASHLRGILSPAVTPFRPDLGLEARGFSIEGLVAADA